MRESGVPLAVERELSAVVLGRSICVAALMRAREIPQLLQNCASAASTCWQLGQFILGILAPKVSAQLIGVSSQLLLVNRQSLLVSGLCDLRSVI